MELKVGDFGLAAWMEPVGQKKKTFCGTLDYIALEVWNGEGHGPESDIWALGCVVYALLVGKLPFWGQDMEETYWRVTEVQYSLPKSLSAAAQKLISGIFRKNPRDHLTLYQILQHEFLTEGFTPAKLPPSSCVTVPQLKPSYPVKGWFIRKTPTFTRQTDLGPVPSVPCPGAHPPEASMPRGSQSNTLASPTWEGAPRRTQATPARTRPPPQQQATPHPRDPGH
uniref:Protein kinase domain-containing protein n=1 Tax=Paramormyrops kingsleyae TaxID=1676925 RepID=A0A3B3QJ11_9TELE